jgi:hypothetical protein
VSVRKVMEAERLPRRDEFPARKETSCHVLSVRRSIVMVAPRPAHWADQIMERSDASCRTGFLCNC